MNLPLYKMIQATVYMLNKYKVSLIIGYADGDNNMVMSYPKTLSEAKERLENFYTNDNMILIHRIDKMLVICTSYNGILEYLTK